jgi:hypothetical protein
VNQPQTVEGAAVWELFVAMTGQVRVARGLITGVDAGAVFQVADSLGVNKFVLAEFFPSIEAAIVRSMNEAIRENGDPQGGLIGMMEDG